MEADEAVEVAAAAVELPPASIAMPWSDYLSSSDGAASDSAVAAGNVVFDRRRDALTHTAGAGQSDLLQRIAPGFERRLLQSEHCYQRQHWNDHGSGCAPSLFTLCGLVVVVGVHFHGGWCNWCF